MLLKMLGMLSSCSVVKKDKECKMCECTAAGQVTEAEKFLLNNPGLSCHL